MNETISYRTGDYCGDTITYACDCYGCAGNDDEED